MPATADLARFLQFQGMKFFLSALRNLPIEDRIDYATRVILLGLLIATLLAVL